MKTRFWIILFVLVGVIFGIFLITNPNPILQLMYSDQYMFETAMSYDVVKSFDEMYPENKVRYVRALDQEPAMVFEMIHDQKMAFLAVGDFQEDNLAFMYKCFSYDYRTTFFELNGILSEKQVRDNPCWEI